MADLATTKINLIHDVTVNRVKYKAGANVEVPKDQADDIQRIAFEHQEYLNNLHKKRTFEVNAGTIAAGGGAE